jgi:hypothetical protein
VVLDVQAVTRPTGNLAGRQPKIAFDAYVDAHRVWCRPLERRPPINVLARRYGLSLNAFYRAMTRGIKRYERTWRRCAP